jgi:hypothetical protein
MAFIANTTTVITNRSAVIHPSFDRQYYANGSISSTISGTEQVLTEGTPATNHYYGSGVAVGNGRIAISYYNGSSYNVEIRDINYNLIKTLTNEGTAAGANPGSIAIGNGRIVIGDTTAQDLQIYDLNANVVSINQSGITGGAAGDQFGIALDVGCGKIVVGARTDDDTGTSSGSAYIFDLAGTQEAKIGASDQTAGRLFGSSVAIGHSRIVIGSPGDNAGDPLPGGLAYVFDMSGRELYKIQAPSPADGDAFGTSVAIGCKRIVVGAPYDDTPSSGAGSACIFDLQGNHIAMLYSENPATSGTFGTYVGISDGHIVVAGSQSADPYTYIFDLNGNHIETIANASGGSLGDLAIGCNRIIRGHRYKTVNSVTNAGQALLYKLEGSFGSHYENVVDMKT